MTRANRYRDVIRQAPDGICVIQRGGRLLEVNEAFAASHGYSVDEMAGMPLEAVDPRWAERITELVARLEAGALITFEAEHRRRDGSSLPRGDGAPRPR
ncbi:MAG: PAS domain S-box protein [Chloroflexota bacterium]